MNSDTQNGNMPPDTTTQHREPTEELQGTSVSALPVVDPGFVEEDAPEEIVSAISQHLKEGESVFVLFRLNSGYAFTLSSGKNEKVPHCVSILNFNVCHY